MNLMSAFISLFWGAKPVRMRLNLCLLNFLKLYAGVCAPLTSAAEDSEGAVKEISLLSLLTCFSKASRVTEKRKARLAAGPFWQTVLMRRLPVLFCRSLSRDALLQELGHAVAVMLEHLREHGDRGHAGEGVDLIEEDLAVGADEEVDSREIAELELIKGLERERADLLLLLIAELCLNYGLGLA